MENKIIAWAKKNGFEWAVIVNNSIEKKHIGILVYTPYSGMYPNDHTRALHIFISNYANRNKLRYESRGHWTGAALYFERG